MKNTIIIISVITISFFLLLSLIFLVISKIKARRIRAKKESLPVQGEEFDKGEKLEGKKIEDPLNFNALVKDLPSMVRSENDRILWSDFSKKADGIIQSEKNLINLIKTFYYFKYLTRGNVLRVLNTASVKVHEQIDKILDEYKPIPITRELVCYHSFDTKNKDKIKDYISECIKLLKEDSDFKEFRRCYELIWNRLSFIDCFVQVIDIKVSNTDNVDELLNYLNIFVGVPFSGGYLTNNVRDLLEKIEEKIKRKTKNYDTLDTPFFVTEKIKAYKEWLYVWSYPSPTYIA